MKAICQGSTVLQIVSDAAVVVSPDASGAYKVTGEAGGPFYVGNAVSPRLVALPTQMETVPAQFLSASGSTMIVNQTAYDAYVASLTPPVPTSITSRQLFIAMARLGWITDAEAIAAANATAIPAVILAVINTLPSDQQRDAKITFARMRDVERNDPLVALAQAALGKTSAQADSMFILGASIS